MCSVSCPFCLATSEHATTSYTEMKLHDHHNSVRTRWKNENLVSLSGIKPKFLGHLAYCLCSHNTFFFINYTQVTICTYYQHVCCTFNNACPPPPPHTHTKFSSRHKDDRYLSRSVITSLGQPGRNQTLSSKSSPRLQQVSEFHQTKHYRS
jgi:hypothetical protein